MEIQSDEIETSQIKESLMILDMITESVSSSDLSDNIIGYSLSDKSATKMIWINRIRLI